MVYILEASFKYFSLLSSTQPLMSEKPLLETCRAWVALLIQPSCAGSRIGLGKERRRTNSRHVKSWMGLWATWS